MTYDLIASSDYLIEENIFLIKIDMSEYLLEYYVQRKDYVNVISAQQDEELKTLIACFAIHLAASTALETHAWTLNMVSEKPYSLFVTGNTGEIGEKEIARSFLVGNVLTENIRHSDLNGFHAQCMRRGSTFNSYVACSTADVVSMVESFYKQSEQRPMRIKLSSNSDSAIGIVALPGFNEEWFAKANLDELASDNDKHEKTRMRNCRFSFVCDCSPEKLLPFLRALSNEEVHEMYGDDKELAITCPRCGKHFAITRELVELN